MKSVLQILLLFHVSLFVSVDSVCPRPPEENGSGLAAGQMFFDPGSEVSLSCVQGYTSVGGSRKIVCKKNGEWTERELKCSPKRCSVPEAPKNGKVEVESIEYRNNITFSCDEGYNLQGASSSQCLHTAQWSKPAPECIPRNCSYPPIPPYGKITYDRPFPNDIVEFGSSVTYHCLPPMVLKGNKRAACLPNGKWPRPPVCKLITCPAPSSIEHGFLTFSEQRAYGYKERVKYGCEDPYVLSGAAEVECEETGLWSKLPECKAPCDVNIERGRIVYRGMRFWIEDFKPKQVAHLEQVMVFCKDQIKDCGYAVSMQCNNGYMPTPTCYEEPGRTTYNIRPGSLPSEIEQCT